MRERITVQTVTRERRTTGELREVWATAFSRWAEVVPAAGDRVDTEHGGEHFEGATFTLRNDSQSAAITPADYRIIWRSGVYYIDSAQPTPGKRIDFTITARRRRGEAA